MVWFAPHSPSLSEPSPEFQLLLGRPHSRAEPAPGRARLGWATGWTAGLEAGGRSAA